jgi:hypothetical protein
MRPPCGCTRQRHQPSFIAVTGGPGAGKTAVLEVVQRQFCEHVVVLPESASILFRGGFPRLDTPEGHRAIQRSIYRVQVELERLAREQATAAVVLCDRGTVDCAAYWPGSPESFWRDLGTTGAAELGRYAAVLHLRTPADDDGYDRSNPLRVETPAQARALDARILDVWGAHPARKVIVGTPTFLEKLEAAIAEIRRHVPACCTPSPRHV